MATDDLTFIDPVDRLLLAQMPDRIASITHLLDSMLQRSPGLPGRLALVAGDLEDIRADLINVLAEIPRAPIRMRQDAAVAEGAAILAGLKGITDRNLRR